MRIDTARVTWSTVMILVAGAIILYTRFANMGLTEMELFISFWPRWTLCLGLLFGAVWIIPRST